MKLLCQLLGKVKSHSRYSGMYMNIHSLSSQVSHIFCFSVVFSIIHGNERAVKNGESLRSLTCIMWMKSEGHNVDVGVRGPHSHNVLDFIIECLIVRQDTRHSQDREYSTWPIRNSSQVYCAQICTQAPTHHFPLPLCLPQSTSRDKCSQAFLFRGALFCFCVSYWMQYREQKIRESLGMRL